MGLNATYFAPEYFSTNSGKITHHKTDKACSGFWGNSVGLEKGGKRVGWLGRGSAGLHQRKKREAEEKYLKLKYKHNLLVSSFFFFFF
jgi:hypothetical protein